MTIVDGEEGVLLYFIDDDEMERCGALIELEVARIEDAKFNPAEHAGSDDGKPCGVDNARIERAERCVMPAFTEGICRVR